MNKKSVNQRYPWKDSFPSKISRGNNNLEGGRFSWSLNLLHFHIFYFKCFEEFISFAYYSSFFDNIKLKPSKMSLAENFKPETQTDQFLLNNKNGWLLTKKAQMPSKILLKISRNRKNTNNQNLFQRNTANRISLRNLLISKHHNSCNLHPMNRNLRKKEL